MRNKYFMCLLCFFISNYLFAQFTVSGILDSTVYFFDVGNNHVLYNSSAGIEEYANLRLLAKREKFMVFGAVNLIAAAGEKAAGMADANTDVSAAANYIAAIELERLYFRLSSDYTNFDGGLMRLPFGYGQVWSPSDFLNPRNPLIPDARPRAILGAAFSWFPVDEIKLLFFYSAPRDALSRGSGSLFGLSLDRHRNFLSIQSLYSYETPDTGSKYGVHRMGTSIKLDLVLGFILDMLYTYNHEAETAMDGLCFSFGADCSFVDGKLTVLAEYLFNGENSSTAYDPEKNILGMHDMHNLYGGLTIRFSSLSNLTAAFIYSYSRYTPVLTFNHELFQGGSLIVTLQTPFDNNSFYGVNGAVKFRLRF